MFEFQRIEMWATRHYATGKIGTFEIESEGTERRREKEQNAGERAAMKPTFKKPRVGHPQVGLGSSQMPEEWATYLGCATPQSTSGIGVVRLVADFPQSLRDRIEDVSRHVSDELRGQSQASSKPRRQVVNRNLFVRFAETLQRYEHASGAQSSERVLENLVPA